MEETQMHDEEQLQKIMEQLQSQFDPRKFMTPSQREIAELSDDALFGEYILVQAKISKRSSKQREYIATRYNLLAQQKQIEVDNLNQETND
jgi:hypothetical protein